MPIEQSVIHIQDLHISFGQQRVINGLSFDVVQGEIFGLLGANGSGKTTVLRALFRMIPFQQGEALFNGKPWSVRYGRNVGYLPEERGLYVKESVIDVMVYFGRLKGLTSKAARAWSLYYLERVGLGSAASKKIEKLSGGMQQKVQLGVTIMNEPDLLILDEPTKGLDPVNRKLLNDIIQDHHQRGATIVLISHQMDQVEDVCDRVLLLKDGQAAAYGPIDEVRRTYGGQRVLVHHRGPLPPVPGVEVITHDVVDGREATHLRIAEEVDVPDLLDHFVRSHIQVESFTPYLSSMNDVFIHLYGKDAA